MDNFFRIPKTDRYEAAGKINLVNGAEWLFELMQKDASLQNLEQLMRYIMYKYTGKDYGVTEFSMQIFDAKDFIEISGGGSKLLKEYIHYWENGSGAPTNADGTKYIVHDDGAGHPTVGYGVDIYNSGYLNEFLSAGYSTEIGAEIDIEFVDALEDREINSNLETIKAMTNGLDLTGYQINALVSRAYNCGVGGAITTLRGSPSMDFVGSYNAYWNSETDDYFEEQNPNANFGHSLYTQYMSKPVTSNNKYMLGLERRRKSEWTLFQTGYYDVLDKWHTGGGDLVAACEELTQMLIARNAHYSLDYGLISRRHRKML
ncbi:MAG: glycoside hydrolase family protein [Clostridia bacterium]